MAGVRMSTPLQALNEKLGAGVIGVMMGLFALAPIALALPAGRWADRHGYHRPIRLAASLTLAGCLCALAATWLMPLFGTAALVVVMCVAAVLTGAGANIGLIVNQRTAGRGAGNPADLRRVFAWLGIAPALANVLGPVLTGALIDTGGFRLAYTGLLLLPLVTLMSARRVPVEPPRAGGGGAARASSWSLLRAPGLARLLLVNWLFSATWDMHALLVPILGHGFNFSASAIGLVLGVFATAVALVRFAVPLLASRLQERQVLTAALTWAAVVLMLYPFAKTAWLMGACAALLGMALGVGQPMIMAALHQITPHDRHGEAIALRSMALNCSSALMPLLFGALGTALGAAALFWLMGAVLGAGTQAARRVGPTPAR
jgi:MFS family permease